MPRTATVDELAVRIRESGYVTIDELVAVATMDRIEAELEPYMVFIENSDQPGRIGRVGTLFGEAGVNIATMAVSRNRPGGNALMALTIDNPLSPELVERLRSEPGFVEVRFIRLGD